MTDAELDAIEARRENAATSDEAASADVDALIAEVRRLCVQNDQLRRDRYEALTVHTKEGLLASEWLARTGRAEATVKRVTGLAAKWRAEPGNRSEDENAYSARNECADELEAALRGGNG